MDVNASREQDTVVRVAMWSGPRNISTAMMRAFENRPDCVVVDEPFYAAYLSMTGIIHPMNDEIIAAGETDWHRVVDLLTGRLPAGRSVFYQKHMTHHMLPDIGRDWFEGVQHAFLIRSPDRVLASYAAKREEVGLVDIGFPAQTEIFDQVADQLGHAPPVIDCDEFLSDPRAQLLQLCDRLGLDFSERMLTWPPGRRDSDGIWAAHWYAAVEASTGFRVGKPGAVPELEPRLADIADQARPHYERLHAHRLRAGVGAA